VTDVVYPDPRPGLQADEVGPHLAETRLHGQPVFEGVLLKIQRDMAKAADGTTCVREYTLHPGAAAIVPVFDNGDLLLERQWRYPLNRSFLEFPAGKLDSGEDPLASAIRELREETGYTASHWARAGQMHPVISYSTEVIHLFLARGLTMGSAALEAGECLDIVRMSQEAFFQAVHAGQVTDAKTMTAAFWLSQWQSKAWQPDWFEPSP
jgi:ADP-ribose pyrophosphatase